jgi:hypothetical protein
VPRDAVIRHRGRRGGRGRRRPVPTVPVVPAMEPSAQTGAPEPQVDPQITTPELPVRPVPLRPKFQPVAPAPRAAKMDVSAISQAVTEATQIVESLKQSLEQMEEVLELVELAERQKLADEREIESLLRALRQLQTRGRPERFERPARSVQQNRSERPEENPQAND